jgi:hypothetical protein
METDSVFFLPWQGEFGCYITSFIRAVHTWPSAKKTVACLRGHECLFPSAEGFYHDYEELVPARRRSGSSATRWVRQHLDLLQERILAGHPHYREHTFVMPFMKYDCFSSAQEVITARFVPRIVPRHLATDVVITPRLRAVHTERNLGFWQEVVDGLKAHGLSVGAVGQKDTSLSLSNVDINSWDFEGIDACIEMMQNAKIVVAQNTGLAHLAVFLEAPMIMMHSSDGMICWMEQQRNKRVFFKIIPADPRLAINEALEYLRMTLPLPC